MTDNIDTPQNANPNDENQAFNGPWPTEPTQTEDSNQTSVEDAFFGSQETTETTEGAPQEGTPPNQPIQEQVEEEGAKNDEKRFEYWQSQAAKAQNQLAQQQQQMEQIQSQFQQQQYQQPPVQQESVDQFPEPPNKPEKPRSFSREEAYADPNSDSARYLDDYDSWRDDMSEYNNLSQQYTIAQMQEKMDGQEQERVANIQRQQAYQQQQEQMRGVQEHLTGHYGFEGNDAQEFIQQMSDPNSLSLDNLVQLYRLQKGQGQNPENTGPSPEFQQTQRAQQIPSPMGVQTGQGGGNDAKSTSDKIMDNMITEHNKNNPW